MKKNARDKALGLIGKYPRTEYQIRLSLEKAGYELAEIEDTAAWLKASGYIDDETYAKRFLEILIEKKRGRRRVADEMRRHGLDSAIIQRVISNGYPETAEIQNAIQRAQKIVEGLPPGMEKALVMRKISLKLIGQGFAEDVIAHSLCEITGDDLRDYCPDC